MTEEINDSVPEPIGYGAKERAMAGALLVAAGFLMFICVDVLTNGRLTGALGGQVPELPSGGDE